MDKLDLAGTRGEFIRIEILEDVQGFAPCLHAELPILILLLILCYLVLTLEGLPTYRRIISFLNVKCRRGIQVLFLVSNSFRVEIKYSLCVYFPLYTCLIHSSLLTPVEFTKTAIKDQIIIL